MGLFVWRKSGVRIADLLCFTLLCPVVLGGLVFDRMTKHDSVCEEI